MDCHNQEIAEIEIRKQRQAIDYNTRDYPLEYFANKVSKQEIKRNLHWSPEQQSYFIESLLLGLPVLEIIVQEKFLDDRLQTKSKIELIDGSQRLYTAVNFLKNNTILINLKKLTSLNGFKFKDLMLHRQKSFARLSVRTIVVESGADRFL